jgi:hypothetical protein
MDLLDPALIRCSEVADFAGEYLEGGLTPAGRERFVEHLKKCPPCERFFNTYEKTPVITRAALAAAMPADVKEFLREYLARARAENKR